MRNKLSLFAALAVPVIRIVRRDGTFFDVELSCQYAAKEQRQGCDNVVTQEGAQEAQSGPAVREGECVEIS